MRLAPMLVLAAALAAATAVNAQPAPSAPAPSQSAPPKADPPKTNPDADAALAVAIRMQKDREERINRVLCAGGDKSKCTAPETASAPAPGAQP